MQSIQVEAVLYLCKKGHHVPMGQYGSNPLSDFFFCILLQDVTEQIRFHTRTHNGRAISNVIIVNHRREASYLLHYLCHYVFVSGLWWYQWNKREGTVFTFSRLFPCFQGGLKRKGWVFLKCVQEKMLSILWNRKMVKKLEEY